MKKKIDHAIDSIPYVVLASVIIGGVIAVLWIWSIEFDSCAPAPLKEEQKAGVDELLDIVKWILTLSVGFVALLGSLALGLKDGPKFSAGAWTLLLSAMICFAFAAYLALMWRMALIEEFFNGCPAAITGHKLQARFDATTNFFFAGLGILAAVICFLLVERRWRD
jgi:hypothetical protein